MSGQHSTPDTRVTADGAGWPAALAELTTPATIRARCREVFATIERGESAWFGFEPAALEGAARLVADITRERFGAGPIAPHSRWQHFLVGGVDRVGPRLAAIGDARERARCLVDLVITSVLLDAGAGPAWSFPEPGTEKRYARSEGLAVASFHWFVGGGFSADSGQPLRADASRLATLTTAAFTQAFAIGDDNPLLGTETRLELLRALGRRMQQAPEWFGAQVTGQPAPRLGGFVDWALARASRADATGPGKLRAAEVLQWVLGALGPIWPGRTTRLGHNLGDVWEHPAAGAHASEATRGLVPFHKLSQWLTYSLLHPLEVAGLTVEGVEELTGLPEYRNGGFLVDSGVLPLRDRARAEQPFAPAHPCIVEWRAATVTLLDRLLPLVRRELGKGEEFTLPMMLEGGSWEAGRRLAKPRGGLPPLELISDGTVF